jgi:hypothetical protein
MREMSVAEQRYEAVRSVIADGETVTSVAARFGVSRKTVHGWLARYEAGGLEGLADRSHGPRSCPHQMPVVVEVALVELRVAHPSWGAASAGVRAGQAGCQTGGVGVGGVSSVGAVEPDRPDGAASAAS